MIRQYFTSEVGTNIKMKYSRCDGESTTIKTFVLLFSARITYYRTTPSPFVLSFLSIKKNIEKFDQLGYKNKNICFTYTLLKTCQNYTLRLGNKLYEYIAVLIFSLKYLTENASLLLTEIRRK